MPGPSFEVRFDGLDRLRRELRATAEQIAHATEAALYVEGEQLMAESKPLVPVDEGVLRASGHVRLPERTADGGVEVLVGFGGPAGAGNHNGATNREDVGYAVYVHEDLTARHTVGQAKFLEAPLRRREPGFSDRIADRIRRAVP